MMVSIAMSQMGMTELIFVVPGMNVYSQYYYDVLLSQQMLPSIKQLQAIQDNNSTRQCSISSCKDTIKQLSYRKKRRTSLVLISGHQTVQT